ncbi:transcriptional regulator YdeO [Escherichia coli]|nr:transcriptional regulator YdeO [Escherichia coli]EFM9320023.1 transcriptional regulator YdeO [Escherichia coli]EGC5035414.1 transcriptional regulator YdeO [Escherichia coli]EGC5072144.1 transcriptional regulator YdeO [Escherichia coli]EHE0865691.1 transcriptional regulator YdeO [Escherichia coli]
MSLVCSVIFIHHAFNANILDKDYAFSDGEILMVDNAVRTHFEPYERHFKEIGFNENTIKKYLQCTNIQTVTMPVPAKFLRASNVPTGLLNEMIAYLNSEERNHHNFSELLLFSCLSIFAACKGFITLLTNGVLSVSGKVRNIVNMKLAHPWKLKDICDCLYISESLLKKKLKQEQTTFSQILLDARMQHAKNLIRVEGSVNKIAEQCGYASTSYFIYAFRKHFGNSPKRVSKEYRCQRYDNTIILFTSDNGAVIDGPLPLNGAQKGYKSQTYPGGTHTPMFMWWKGKLQPGNYDKLISAMDFYPTALDAADISIPKDLKLDGVSLLPWLQNKKQGEPHKNLTWITSYSHWFDEENIPFWDNYHKFVRHQSDDYPHNPNTEDLSQFSYTVRNNDYSLVYTVENNQLGLYKLTDLQQKDNLAAANPQVVKEMQGVVREFIDNSQPPLSEVNQEKFNNIKKALSKAK